MDEFTKISHTYSKLVTGPLKFLLGCDYFRDSDGTLCYAPKKYLAKMIDVYKELFGQPPRSYLSPLEKGDHPELDESELLNAKHTQIYQSLIGAAQWIIQLGRFEITTHIMSLSSFRSAPRHGHMRRIKRVFGYLSKFRHSAIHIRTDEPDLSDVNFFDYDWTYSPYAGAREILPDDIPPPLGKHVTMTTYVDANLCREGSNRSASLLQQDTSRLVHKEASHSRDSHVRQKRSRSRANARQQAHPTLPWFSNSRRTCPIRRQQDGC